MRNHTGTHVLHRALRNNVGERARQAGSLVTPDYLRFDFPFDRALTDEEKRAIEAEVRARRAREPAPSRRASCPWPRPSRRAPTRSSTRSTASRCASCSSTATPASCAAERIARRPGQIGSFVITGERVDRQRHAPHRGADRRCAPTHISPIAWRCSTTATAEAGARDADSLPDRIRELQERNRELERRLARRRWRHGTPDRAGGAAPKPWMGRGSLPTRRRSTR